MKSEKVSLDYNIWETFYPPEEASDFQIRSMLMMNISILIKKQNLTFSETAKILGVSLLDVENIISGKIDLLSQNDLIVMWSKMTTITDLNSLLND